MFHAAAFLLMLAILLLIGGPTLVRKFLRGYFVGVDVYVFLTLDGKEIAYKNPKGFFGHEDEPWRWSRTKFCTLISLKPTTTSAGLTAEHCFGAVTPIIERRKTPDIATRTLGRVSSSARFSSSDEFRGF